MHIGETLPFTEKESSTERPEMKGLSAPPDDFIVAVHPFAAGCDHGLTKAPLFLRQFLSHPSPHSVQ